MQDEQDPNVSGDGTQDSSGYGDTSQSSTTDVAMQDNTSPAQTDTVIADEYDAGTASGVQMGAVNVLDPEVLRRAAQQVVDDEATAVRNWIEAHTDDLTQRIFSGMPELVAYVKQNAPSASGQADEQIQIWLSEWARNHNLTIPPFNIFGPIPARTLAAPSMQHISKGDAVRAGLDLSGDTKTYQVSVVIRNANLISGGDCGPALDFLHEPQAGIQILPPPDNQYIAQAAVNILDLHLRDHCPDLVEATLAAQGGVNLSSGSPSGAGQLQIELHLSATLSLTASTSVNVSPRGSGGGDPGNVPLGDVGGADLSWTPFTLSTLVHF